MKDKENEKERKKKKKVIPTTASCSSSTDSISKGPILYPADFITSSALPTYQKYPSLSLLKGKKKIRKEKKEKEIAEIRNTEEKE